MTGTALHRNFIGGEWRDGHEAAANVNPSDLADTIGDFAHGTPGDVNDAVAAARAAAPAWAGASPQVRAELLDAIGTVLVARKDEIGHLLSREEGKTLAEGVGETVRAGQIFKFFAGEALRLTGDAVASVRTGVDVTVTREPVGVVGMITPWNFPIAIPAWKIAPALAFGNTVVIKPAELTPASAHALAEILDGCGCPAGVFNLVMGCGATVGDALTGHPDMGAISFTGSMSVGHGIARRAAEGMKKVQLEMGGKNPMVVMDDADLDLAVATALNSAFFSTGQRCTATSRIIVHRAVHNAFAERLTRAMAELRVGHALDSDSQIGPVASEQQLQSNLAYIALAREEGCEVIGGERLERRTKGYFQAPALFLNAKPDMRIAREEIFGPCAALLAADDFEHAVALANDTEFGLSAGIATTSLRHASEFRRRAQAGMVMVNLPTAGVDYHVPFGGRKGSSHGPREQGRYAAEFYTTVKTAYVLA